MTSKGQNNPCHNQEFSVVHLKLHLLHYTQKKTFCSITHLLHYTCNAPVEVAEPPVPLRLHATLL